MRTISTIMDDSYLGWLNPVGFLVNPASDDASKVHCLLVSTEPMPSTTIVLYQPARLAVLEIETKHHRHNSCSCSTACMDGACQDKD